MIERRFDAIVFEDIQSLIDSRRPEGRRLDFKRELPDRSERAAKEFLADVSSFANADGGDIIFGMDENAGVASTIVGLGDVDLEKEILRLESLARTGLDPRLPQLRFRPIELEGTRVVVARIEASLVAPHRVTLGGTSRFHSRNSSGKFEMDTTELRRAFAATDELPRKMRDLHKQGVARLRGENMPCVLETGAAVVFTLAPMSIHRELRDLAVTRENAIYPPFTGGLDMAVGLDGVVTYAAYDPSNREVSGWAFNHRVGFIDQAWTIGRIRDGEPRAWPKYFQDRLKGALRSALTNLRNHKIDGPWVAMVSLVGVKNYRLILGDHYYTDPAWQDEAYLGEVVDEDMNVAALEPIWLAFLRVFGEDRSLPWDKSA